MRMAMNGRMGLLGGGVIILLTAITSTLTYGINMFHIISQVAKGDKEFIEILEKANLEVGLVRVLGICFLILAVLEIFAGIFSLRLCNRLDKCFFMRKIIFILIGTEVLMQILLFMSRMPNLGMLITSLLIPLYMLWSVTRLCKLAKIYPERIYVVEKKKPAQAPSKAPKKSIHERAMMTSSLSDAETSEEEASEGSSEAPAIETIQDESCSEEVLEEESSESESPENSEETRK